MAKKIITNWQDVVIGLKGGSRIDDTDAHDDLTVLSIIAETDSVVNTLEHVDENGTVTDALITRNLTEFKSGITYLPGRNCYFKKIKLDSGKISINE